MGSPRASIVIPTWNGRDLLAQALLALEGQTYRDFEVVVVDNGSTDGTPEWLAAEHPEVRLVRFSDNRGFAPAVNAGIRASRGGVVALLNNDTEAHPEWLGALVRTLVEHPEVGSCASKMLMHADPTRIDSAGDQFGLFASAIGHGRPDGPAFAQPYYVISASAGAAAYRREALEDVGLLDERFFAYFEDIDLGIRLQLAGYKCLYVPDAVVLHHGSATARRISGFKFFLLMRNSLFVFFQYAPASRVVLWGPAVLIWPFVRAAIDRQPLRLAMRAIAGFLRELPAVIRRRREIDGTRRIPRSEFRRCLAGALARQGSPPSAPSCRPLPHPAPRVASPVP